MENLNIPQHVAIILDGNGRWAKKRHLPRNMGRFQFSVENAYTVRYLIPRSCASSIICSTTFLPCLCPIFLGR